MKKLLAVVLLVGCGNTPCDDEHNLYVKGLCINSNGYDIDTQKLEKSIEIAEEGFNHYFPDNPVDLEYLFIENETTLKFSDYIGPRTLGVTIRYKNAETGEDLPVKMFVVGWTCKTKNFITAHEILHVVAIYHLKTPDCGHTCEKLFFEWAEENNLPREETVEGYLLENIKPLCMTDDNN